jgi:hypothetical protein
MQAMRHAYTHLERQVTKILLATRRSPCLALRISLKFPGSPSESHPEPGTTLAPRKEAA